MNITKKLEYNKKISLKFELGEIIGNTGLLDLFKIKIADIDSIRNRILP